MVAVDDILMAPKDGESRIFTALFGDKGFFPIPVSFEQIRNTQNGKKPPGHRPDGFCVRLDVAISALCATGRKRSAF